MIYVYLLQSLTAPECHVVLTTDLKQRLTEHATNSQRASH